MGLFNKKKSSVNVEIDYEKLSKAIVTAEKKARDEENKLDGTAVIMQSILCFALLPAIFFSLAIAAYGTYLIITSSITLTNVIVTVCCFGYFLILVYFSRQISKIKDKHYLMSIFAALTSLFGFIVSLVALLRSF